MTLRKTSASGPLRGSPAIPGDKSISHRSLILGALSEGRTEVEGLLESDDVRSTARCLKALGVGIEISADRVRVDGIGARGFRTPTGDLDCGNSGTTLRVLMGVLAGRDVTATLTGDSSLVKRPMKRVSEPLGRMGARFELTRGDYAPLKVIGGRLRAIDYALPVASAQIKTAIMLAALTAEGTTRLTGEIHSRDHTERMLRHFGATVHVDATSISVAGGQKLKGAPVRVPGDPSTAAFWAGAAAMIAGSRVEMANISLNPTRTGFFRLLRAMGAPLREEETGALSEPVGRVIAESGRLRGVLVPREEIPTLIDELPLLAVIATQAHGRTVVEGAEELRVKETDRIEAVATNLRAMGAVIETRPDGYVIEGPQKLRGAEVDSFGDHRIAMAFAIAGLVASGETAIRDADAVSVSYPGFFAHLQELTGT